MGQSTVQMGNGLQTTSSTQNLMSAKYPKVSSEVNGLEVQGVICRITLELPPTSASTCIVSSLDLSLQISSPDLKCGYFTGKLLNHLLNKTTVFVFPVYFTKPCQNR